MDQIKNRQLRELIDDTLEVRLLSCGRADFDAPRVGSWTNIEGASLTLMVRGEAFMEFKSGEKVRRPQGCLCCFPASNWRRTILPGSAGGNIAWCRCRFLIFNGFDLLSLYEVPYILGKINALRFRKIHQELLNLDPAAENIFETGVRRRELCYALLGLVLAESTLKPDAFRRISTLQRFDAVLKYLNKHFSETVKVDTLAKLACLSKSQFHRQFKAAFGLAPLAYLKKLRLQNASRLLRHSDLSIMETGEYCGWRDQFHFSRIFKAAVGVSPDKYRRRVREDFDSFLAGF
ncbi:MAG: AraC family transcriptional regulator [Victivallales bacterium]|nr:AraC family transcriptional regulator [Victivallales bacterium]